jgi:hypothetical protein
VKDGLAVFGRAHDMIVSLCPHVVATSWDRLEEVCPVGTEVV